MTRARTNWFQLMWIRWFSLKSIIDLKDGNRISIMTLFLIKQSLIMQDSVIGMELHTEEIQVTSSLTLKFYITLDPVLRHYTVSCKAFDRNHCLLWNTELLDEHGRPLTFHSLTTAVSRTRTMFSIWQIDTVYMPTRIIVDKDDLQSVSGIDKELRLLCCEFLDQADSLILLAKGGSIMPMADKP